MSFPLKTVDQTHGYVLYRGAGVSFQLTVVPKAAGRFDSLADQRRTVVQSAGGTPGDSDDVDLTGAERAVRTTATPAKAGSDPVEVDSTALQATSPVGDVAVLSAAVPQRDGARLDADAVIASFRFVTGSQ